MKIYLDACCYNRPFDDQSQDRILLESQAISLIFKRSDISELEIINSEVIEFEIEQNSDIIKKLNVKQLLLKTKYIILLNEKIVERAKELENIGFKSYDSLHLASAESDQIKIFLTTDDKLLKLALRSSNKLFIKVMNPLNFIEEII